jgi:hypothetical protein
VDLDTACPSGTLEVATRVAARERPILFSAPMIRALLSGAKTQTRRVIAPGRDGTVAEWRTAWVMDAVKRWAPSMDGWWTMAVDGGHIGSVQCPYGVPGDRLWVREAFYSDTLSPDTEYQHVHYREGLAHGHFHRRAALHLDGKSGHRGPWRPSIHMPRWASRITLEVTDVRVQRLQDISEDDARAEGVDADPVEAWFDSVGGAGDPYAAACSKLYRFGFAKAWDSINGKRCPWSSNPWTWAISFKRVTP